jgi:hypothetical protein
MTEAEWLASEDPSQMLAFLEGRGYGSNRKFRLYAVGCCRSVWSWLKDVRSRSAVEAAERYADGYVTPDEMRLAFINAIAAVSDCRDSIPSEYQAIAAYLAAARNINESESKIPESEDANEVASHVWSYIYNNDPSGSKMQAPILLRDISGNPFHPLNFDPAWQTEHTVGIALRMYDDRDFDAMPILADALEEAGCDNADILNHCRKPGVHVRGCWVVDWVLGKQ